MKNYFAVFLLPLSLFTWWWAVGLNRAATSTLFETSSGSNGPSVLHGDMLLERQQSLKQKAEGPFPSNKADNIFYFVHISDVHVSKFYTTGGIQHLRTFLNTTLKVVDPSFVLVTGGNDTHAEHIQRH
jgi:hypothetical protein